MSTRITLPLKNVWDGHSIKYEYSRNWLSGEVRAWFAERHYELEYDLKATDRKLFSFYIGTASERQVRFLFRGPGSENDALEFKLRFG